MAATIVMTASSGSTTWLEDAAARDPGRAALIDAAGATLSYGELLDRARSLTQELEAEHGLLVLELEPGLEHAVAVHAAILAGRAVMTVRPGLPGAEREQVLAAGEVSAPQRATLARVLSSGTTGPRRPIDLSCDNFAASAAASAANLGAEDGDVWLACMPMDHVGGLSILIRSVIYGTTALLHPRFDVESVAEALAADEPRVSCISLVPTQLRRLLDAGAPLDRLRFALIGGAALDRATLEAALGAGAPVVQTYGLTEACSQVCTLGPGEAREHLGSSGRPLPGIEVAIEDGRIAVRGANVAAGAAEPDGWLRTADLGRIDPAGYLWVEGRADDVIVSGGENVMPEAVEEALLAHAAVADAAVVGLPDPDWGEAVTAVVVLAADADADEAALIEHCRARVRPADGAEADLARGCRSQDRVRQAAARPAARAARLHGRRLRPAAARSVHCGAYA